MITTLVHATQSGVGYQVARNGRAVWGRMVKYDDNRKAVKVEGPNGPAFKDPEQLAAEVEMGTVAAELARVTGEEVIRVG